MKYKVETCSIKNDNVLSVEYFDAFEKLQVYLKENLDKDKEQRKSGLYYAIQDISMRGIYLAAFKAEHPDHNIVYQDINGKRDIGGDMMEIDLTPYDFIIATPPCNWWSRANYRRDRSPYALQTKHLLPDIIKKLCEQDKPFIVENVKNKLKFTEYGLFSFPCYVYFVGRHTYWSNVMMDLSDIHQEYDFGHNENGNTIVINKDGHREGGKNVNEVIERFLEVIGA